MLKSNSWSPSLIYESNEEFDPVRFFCDGFFESNQASFLLGYFSSSAINVLSLGFAYFIYNGGNLHVVINDILSKRDKDSLLSADNEQNFNLLDIENFQELHRKLDDYGKHFFECLAWLINQKRIVIKIIKPMLDIGISHYKNGMFDDGKNKVGFTASCNFTANGLLENLERVDVYLDWEDKRSQSRISSIEKTINDYIAQKNVKVRYVSPENICIAIESMYGDKSIEELLLQENELFRKKIQFSQSNSHKKYFESLTLKIQNILNRPRFPYSAGPRPYQIDAYKSWKKNGERGIFSMATGTGKTITALYCLLEQYKLNKKYYAIIIVPTLVLLSQWQQEAKKFNFSNFILVSANKDWKKDLLFQLDSLSAPNSSFIILVTYASFKKEKFQNYIGRLPILTLLIADEAHNLGSPQILKLLSTIKIQSRIGLSATPNRKYDENGNVEIEKFFNDKNPYVYSFSMKQAIDQGFLCQYTYHPHIVELAEEEFREYAAITRQLSKYLQGDDDGFKDSPEVEKLLILRKKIVHKAINKKAVFKRIVETLFSERKSLKYTLVYVPEGNEANYSDYEGDTENEEEVRLLDEYARVVRDVDQSIIVQRFVAETANRDEILENYESGKIDVLVSMKCLDEGIDVPRSEVAIFCASTGNPRQFIQRRGRVLRPHKDKSFAIIHDLVVIPPPSEEGSFEMERNLVKNEIDRVIEFSKLALNSMESYNVMKKTLKDYNLPLV